MKLYYGKWLVINCFTFLTELRRTTIPVFFDMMQCEFMSVVPAGGLVLHAGHVQQKKRNFDKVVQLFSFATASTTAAVCWFCFVHVHLSPICLGKSLGIADVFFSALLIPNP